MFQPIRPLSMVGKFAASASLIAGLSACGGALSVSPLASTTPASTASSGSSTSSSSGAGSASGTTSTPTTPSTQKVAPFYVYQNDSGTGAHGLNKYWDYDYSYGGSSGTVPIEYTDKTHVQPGHTYDMHVPKGMAWQPAADANQPFGVGPFGHDISPFTWMTFDIWTAYPNQTYDILWEYAGNAATKTADQPSSAYVPNIQSIPGIAHLNGNGWTTVKIPLAYFGNLGMHAAYKFYIRDNTSSGLQEYFLDNAGFVPGSHSWIYDGGAVISWNSSASTWNWDPSEPINGWADATPSGSIANYSFNPTALTSSFQYVGNSLNGLVTPGYGPTIISTNAIEVSTTIAGGMWKVTNSAGFTLAPYQYLTFGVMPTNKTRSFKVQFYSTNGTPIGSALDAAPYTNADWGPTGGHWTVYCIPLADFGSLPAQVGGMSIQDTSGLTTNTFYISAPGFFN